VRRGLRIILTVCLHALRYAWHVVFVRGRDAAGESLASLFEDLGPSYIKIGQILSCRPDLVSPRITAALSRLQDQVKPVDPEVLLAALREDLATPLEAVFSSIDSKPVASASIAQVHRACLRDGRDVAVKIRRPGVDALVAADFRIVAAIASALSTAPILRALPLRELVEEIRCPIEQQLDFVHEAECNRRLRRIFRHAEHIRIPMLVDELCTASTLTMDFVPGLGKLTASGLEPAQCRTAALSGLRALYKMIFLHGFIHADMHPGNVFIHSSGDFVLLDTGLMAELNGEDRLRFVDFFFGLVNNRGAECAAIVLDMALRRPGQRSVEKFERAMGELIGRHSALPSRDFEVTRFVAELIETQRRCGVHGSTRFMTVVLSMVVYDGICKQLYPDCDFQAEARPYLIAGRYGKPMASRALQAS
jgi:ubiquinone biosynthesis protein